MSGIHLLHQLTSTTLLSAKANQLSISYLPRRFAGFQPGSSGLSMEIKMRLIERKKKKVEKLAKQQLDYIPITDFFIPYSWKLDTNKRFLSKDFHQSAEELEKQILLEKEWSRLIKKKREELAFKIKQLQCEQEKALKELREESIELHEAALKCEDLTDLKFSCRGPVQSLPLKNYLPPLGGFIEKEPPFSTDATTLEQKR